MAQNSGQQVVTPHGVSNATVGLVRARQVNSARICTPRLRLSHESTSAGKQLEFAYRSIATSDRLTSTPVNLQPGTMCCICQDRQVMVDRISRTGLRCFTCCASAVITIKWNVKECLNNVGHLRCYRGRLIP